MPSPSLLQSIKRSLPGAQSNSPLYRAIVSAAAATRQTWRELKLSLLERYYRLPELDLKEIVPNPPALAEIILDQACMPPHANFPHDDFTPLMLLACAMKPSVIVELGTAHGNTTANLARNCPGAAILTVNAPMEVMTGKLTTYSLEASQIGEVYRNAGYADRITQIFANTLELDLTDDLGGRKVDLAIVDACHDTEYVENDFLKIVPFLSENGVILLHDNHPSMAGHLRGSYVASMRLRRQGHDIRQLKNCWWGIYRRDWRRPLS